MSLEIKTVAVIGAGISGVVSAAHLKSNGLDVTVFERSNKTGGVWVFDERLPPEPSYPSIKPSIAHTAYFSGSKRDSGKFTDDGNVERDIEHAPPGPCYEGLMNNVPTGLMKVTLNSWPAGTEGNVNHKVLAAYIQDTASKSGVDQLTIYNTKVEELTKSDGKWKVRTSTISPDVQTSRDWEFDAVVVATGHYDAPKVPDIPGLNLWKQEWPETILHSKRYRSPRDFKDKTVLLIGGSTSSTDIANELEGNAKQIYQSTRGGAFDHPVSMLPASATRVGEVSSFNIIRDANSPAVSRSVTLKSGQILSNIDSVIVCTGYHCSFPFLKQYHADHLTPDQAGPETLVTDGLQTHNLHKDIFYIPDPTLSFIGVPYHIATFSLFEFQAIALAAVYSGKAALPPLADQRAEYDERVRKKGQGREFHSLRGQDVDYANELLAWVNPGIVASGGAPIQGHSEEWQKQYDVLRQKLAIKKTEEIGAVGSEKLRYVAGIEAVEVEA